ncbi:MAG: Type 1 glutamine amidotransferase-like domain-containing protein [Oscillospiraceae bacterium]
MNGKRIILTSKGLNCKQGREIITSALESCPGGNFREYFSDKTIMLCTLCEYEIGELLTDAALALGFRRENIVVWDEYVSKSDMSRFSTYDVCYVSEGNTFQLAQTLRLTGADSVIGRSVSGGGMYIGASAGAILATSGIEYALDRNCVMLTDYSGLDILPAELGKTALLPHFDAERFAVWLRENEYFAENYDYIDFIPDTEYKLF